MKNSEGFSQADSTNLPRVETIMMMEFMQGCDKYNLASIRGAKASLSSRSSYVDTAVGYVEVKRQNSICYVQCRLTPEHRVRSKMYQVSAEIDEEKEIIIDVSCHDCAASEGGCKHALCFLMWLVKKTEEPSTTSTTCYWKRPKLSAAITQDKFILVSSIGKRNPYNINEEVPTLQNFLTEAKNHDMKDSLIMSYNFHEPSLNDYCVFQVMLSFVTDNQILNKTFKEFKSYAAKKITPEVISDIESKTRNQVNCKLWHSMRQSRVTASKLYEATRCKKDEGALVQMIMGGYKVPETAAIKRGKKLEKEVIKQLEEELNLKIQMSGFILITPLIGASPDGICDDFVVEIKCPSTEKTLKNYLKDNIMSKKCQAQIQAQMHAAKKNKGLFCVADPKFEEGQKVYKIWVKYNKDYANKLINEAETFWEKYIFKKVLECCQ